MQQEHKDNKSIVHYIRSLHRDIGYLMIGLILIYSVSGIFLIYRDTDFLKTEQSITKTLQPDMKPQQLGMALHLRDFKVEKTEGNTIYFKEGTYNTSTGVVNYTTKALPFVLEKLNSLHKTASSNASHIFSVIFAVLLLFLALSSFWMFKPKAKPFRRGIIFAGIGFVFAFIMLMI